MHRERYTHKESPQPHRVGSSHHHRGKGLENVGPTRHQISHWFFKYDKMAQWTADNVEAIKEAPKVQF